jgi:hypothetical protein
MIATYGLWEGKRGLGEIFCCSSQKAEGLRSRSEGRKWCDEMAKDRYDLWIPRMSASVQSHGSGVSGCWNSLKYVTFFEVLDTRYQIARQKPRSAPKPHPSP